MTPEPTKEQLATEKAEELSRFESEGGWAEHADEQPCDESPSPGLQPAEADDRGRILIIYAIQERHTCAIVDALAFRLRSHGFAVEIGAACTGTMPPPQDYDLVILGLPMAFGRESTMIATYVEQNRAGLSDVPSAVFTVSKSGMIRDHDPGSFLQEFLRGVGWRPDVASAFSGGPAVRTSWTDVQGFADAIATHLADAAIFAERTEPYPRRN